MRARRFLCRRLRTVCLRWDGAALGTFSFKRRICPRCHKTLWPWHLSQEESLIWPLPSHTHRPSSHTVASQVSSCPESQGHHEGSFTAEWPSISTVTERALPSPHFGVKPPNCSLGFSLSKCRSGVEAEAVAGTAVADHRWSKWTWGQAAWGCATLARCGASLGLSLHMPIVVLAPPTSQPWSHPTHVGNGHCSGQFEHPRSFCSSRPHLPATPSTTLTHSRCLLSTGCCEQNL